MRHTPVVSETTCPPQESGALAARWQLPPALRHCAEIPDFIPCCLMKTSRIHHQILSDPGFLAKIYAVTCVQCSGFVRFWTPLVSLGADCNISIFKKSSLLSTFLVRKTCE